MPEKEAPIGVVLYHHAKNLAMGNHPLAKYVPALLLLVDSVLCSLIISYVPCKLERPPPSVQTDAKIDRRYRDRLGSIYGAD